MSKIGVLENKAKRARGSRGIFSGLIAAIGSAWTSRKTRTVEPKVRLVAWAVRANTDSWFLLQLEQQRNSALYYYARSQIR